MYDNFYIKLVKYKTNTTRILIKDNQEVQMLSIKRKKKTKRKRD